MPLEPSSEGMVPLLRDWTGGSMKTQQIEGMRGTREDWVAVEYPPVQSGNDEPTEPRFRGGGRSSGALLFP